MSKTPIAMLRFSGSASTGNGLNKYVVGQEFNLNSCRLVVALISPSSHNIGIRNRSHCCMW